MAKANWIKTTPSQGSGNAIVNVSSTGTNEGIDREAFIVFKGGGLSVERIVRQEG